MLTEYFSLMDEHRIAPRRRERLSAPPDISSATDVHCLADWHSRRGAIARESEIFPMRFERLPVTPTDYEYLRKLLRDHSGLDLSADKQYLIESRLLPLSRKSGLSGISELVQRMKGGSASIITQVVEAMTTNETFFFRDKTPFDHFRDSITPEILRARASRKSIRIWCAAGSTGQEPYSLAMCLKEMSAAIAGWRVEILATDLSQEVIEKSKAGLYSQFEVQRGLPIQMLVKYFKQTGEIWQINPDIRAMVQHRQLNLLHDFSQFGVFDVIFCRNVLIYFDQNTKIGIFNRLARTTEPDGFLVLGAAETVVGLTDVFKPYPERRGLYQPSGALTAPPKMPVPGAAAPKVAAMAGL
jgi:chemotaxis protein methyltransferase CheR